MRYDTHTVGSVCMYSGASRARQKYIQSIRCVHKRKSSHNECATRRTFALSLQTPCNVYICTHSQRCASNYLRTPLVLLNMPSLSCALKWGLTAGCPILHGHEPRLTKYNGGFGAVNITKERARVSMISSESEDLT